MITDILNTNLQPQNEFIFGTADLTGLIDKKFGEFTYGISIGRRLNDDIVDRIENGPTIEYYNYYNQINKKLADLSQVLKVIFQKQGIDSIVLEPTIILSAKENAKYLPTLTVDISHKMAATRAGLGWIGKTGLFISNKFGPRLRLVTLLIKQKPEFDRKPIEKSKCGNCTICVDTCPAQAANGELWNVNVHRDEFFYAHKCRDMCNELAVKKLKVDKRICGICVSVCPVGKKN